MKVLVVDDNQANRNVLRYALRGFGHEVIEAVNGLEGVELFTQHRPSMVLMDVNMPVMDGYEACQQIKQVSGDDFVPVLFVTAYDDTKTMRKSVEAGADDYIVKPINVEALKAKIKVMQRIQELHDKNSKNQQELLEYKRSQTHQLDVVESVFSKILGRGDIQSNAVTRYIKPVSQFNGDILIYAYSPSGTLNVMLGDFTGHGLSAAIGALPVSDIFYDLTEKGFAISDIAVEINSKLVEILPVEMFCAAILIEVNGRENMITIWNGGMPDVLILDSENKVIERCKSTKRALGVGAGGAFDRNVDLYELPNASSVVLVSDGVIESLVAEKKHLGMKFVVDCIENTPANEVSLHRLIHNVEEATAGFHQKDDMSYAEIIIGNIELEWRSLRFNKIVDNSPSLEWEVKTHLSADKLKAINPVPLLLNMLMNFQGPTRHRERIFTVLAELFSNSFEHGVLKLDSTLKETPEGFAQYYLIREQRMNEFDDGWINFSIKHSPDNEGGGSLIIMVEDSGDGFDYESREEIGMADIAGFCGRGIALLKNLCDEVNYSKNGNKVTVSYRW